MAQNALARVADGGLRLDHLVGAEGKSPRTGGRRPGVERFVVAGCDRHDGRAHGELLGCLEPPVVVRVVPDGIGGAVVHRELRALEGRIALGVVPELAVLVLVALRIALADDETSALRVLSELACRLDLDDGRAALGVRSRHAQMVAPAVEQVAAGRVELAHLDVAEGDALEHHGSAVRLALDRLGAAAPLVARLVESPVEAGVALRACVPRLGVELLEDEAHGDGRLCGSECVVVAGAHLVDVAIEHVAG